jgi:hypothetical protein
MAVKQPGKELKLECKRRAATQSRAGGLAEEPKPEFADRLSAPLFLRYFDLFLIFFGMCS